MMEISLGTQETKQEINIYMPQYYFLKRVKHNIFYIKKQKKSIKTDII